jgi:hypothetical protein
MLGIMAKTGLAGVALGSMSTQAAEAPLPSLAVEGAKTLQGLMAALDHSPRRRDFKKVPMILTNPDQWDHEALTTLMHYKGKVKQVWDNTAIDGPWLNLMRNSMNCQIWGFKHPDFLCVSATHGPAHLALYDQHIWDKYQISKLTKDKYKENTFLNIPGAAHADPKNFEDESGVFAPEDNSIAVLQARGAVFLACHNAIFEVSHKLHKKGVNPDKLTVPQMVAEFTNHLIPGVILTPGIVGTLPELGFHGFQYAK